MRTMDVYIAGDCPVKIWGLTPRERIERVAAAAGTGRILNTLDDLDDKDTVLILRGDYLHDDRLIHYLAETPGMVVQAGEGPEQATVAAHVSADSAPQVLRAMEGNTPCESMGGVRLQSLEELSLAYRQTTRKSEPVFALPVSAENRRDLEKRLFEWSYKGVTDLITKWLWPVPARWAVGQCVRLGLRPNHITFLGLLLVILAGVLFARGQYGWGLLAGWMMTFLDTVDGKLARVTVTSSRFGHYFDHIIDLVHPPIWYILWGVGLAGAWPAGLGFSLHTVLWTIVIGYVAGRLAEGLFKWFFGKFGIFCWRPADSYFRLITARRNPNLVILTVSLFVGRPDLGILAVAFWTVATSLFLAARLAWAAYARSRHGPLSSWLMDAHFCSSGNTLAVRWFTRHTSE